MDPVIKVQTRASNPMKALILNAMRASNTTRATLPFTCRVVDQLQWLAEHLIDECRQP